MTTGHAEVPDDVPVGEEVEVYRGGGGDIERAFLEAALREADIPFVVRGAGIAQHPVYVGPADEQRARALLQEVTTSEPILEDSDEDAEPLALGFRRQHRPRDRRLLLVLGALCLALALYLLIPYRDASLFGILLLIPGILFLFASRR